MEGLDPLSFVTLILLFQRKDNIMSRKIQNPEKLQSEIQLQKSKFNSLSLLDKELKSKMDRLSKQREDIRVKSEKLKHRILENEQRLQSLGTK